MSQGIYSSELTATGNNTLCRVELTNYVTNNQETPQNPHKFAQNICNTFYLSKHWRKQTRKPIYLQYIKIISPWSSTSIFHSINEILFDLFQKHLQLSKHRIEKPIYLECINTIFLISNTSTFKSTNEIRLITWILTLQNPPNTLCQIPLCWHTYSLICKWIFYKRTPMFILLTIATGLGVHCKLSQFVPNMQCKIIILLSCVSVYSERDIYFSTWNKTTPMSNP